jgi:hypothetical protein
MCTLVKTEVSICSYKFGNFTKISSYCGCVTLLKLLSQTIQGYFAGLFSIV